uniref:Uncharacterized protein n=1 Tax=Anguilla anguilla TaxID=7936 RepID=A0A0E9XNW3_ANGAN
MDVFVMGRTSEVKECFLGA